VLFSGSTARKGRNSRICPRLHSGLDALDTATALPVARVKIGAPIQWIIQWSRKAGAR
jgi:hypothetical protein